VNEYRIIITEKSLSGSPDYFSWSINCVAYRKARSNDKSKMQDVLTEYKQRIRFQCENKNHYDEMYDTLSKIQHNSVILISAVQTENCFEQAIFIEMLTPFADEITFIERYNTPVIVSDIKTGMMFTLNKQFDCYEGKIIHNGENVDISLDNIKCNMQNWHHIMDDLNNLVTAACVFAANELTDLAIDWSDVNDNDEHNYDENPITKDEFARRIKLQSISLSPNNNYTFWFDDDGLFFGHDVSVDGNIETGFSDARME